MDLKVKRWAVTSASSLPMDACPVQTLSRRTKPRAPPCRSRRSDMEFWGHRVPLRSRKENGSSSNQVRRWSSVTLFLEGYHAGNTQGTTRLHGLERLRSARCQRNRSHGRDRTVCDRLALLSWSKRLSGSGFLWRRRIYRCPADRAGNNLCAAKGSCSTLATLPNYTAGPQWYMNQAAPPNPPAGPAVPPPGPYYGQRVWQVRASFSRRACTNPGERLSLMEQQFHLL